MTPLEIMNRARNDEFDRWEVILREYAPHYVIIHWPKGEEFERTIAAFDERGDAEDKLDHFRSDASMRAALRAFAEMEPTEKMRELTFATEDDPEVYEIQVARAYILAAAAEVANG